MKRTLAILSVILASFAANAQNEALTNPSDTLRKSHINVELNPYFAADLTGGRLDEAAFHINRVRLEILGRVTDRLSYHFRQSYNKYSNPFALDDLASSIEYANITWHQGERFQVIAGKEFVSLGGYEYYVNAIRVREFSDFNNSVACYQAGIMGIFNLTPSQEIVLQVTNIRSGNDSDAFLYGLPAGMEKTRAPLLATLNWNGNFLEGALQFRYAASAGSLAKGGNIYYLTAGNIYEKGPVLAYIDLMYSREGIDSQGRLSALQINSGSPVTMRNAQYLTAIANVDYSPHPKWNVYIKGVYERTGTYREDGSFGKGLYCTDWNIQGCIEHFPFTEDKGLKVYLHYVHKGSALTSLATSLGAVKPDTDRISLGIVYIIPVM